MRGFNAVRFGALLPILFACIALTQPLARADACPPDEPVTVARRAKAVSGDSAAGVPAAVPAAWARVLASRRAADDGPMILGFKDAPMDQVLRFIVESTGKTLMSRLSQVTPTKITLLSDRPLPRSECLDRVYEAMANSNLSVIEDEEVVWIDLMPEARRSPRLPLAVTADENIDGVSCNGLITSMVLRLREAQAPTVVAQLSAFTPDFATVVFDAERNQLLVQSTVGSAKQIRRLAEALDCVATVDEGARSAEWTQIPTVGDASGKRKWRDPRSETQIASMTKQQVVTALQEVSRTRQRTGLSDEVRAQLKREFDALLTRLKTLDTAGG